MRSTHILNDAALPVATAADPLAEIFYSFVIIVAVYLYLVFTCVRGAINVAKRTQARARVDSSSTCTSACRLAPRRAFCDSIRFDSRFRVTGSKCPVDNLRIRGTQLFQDNFAKREVLSLRVKCANRERGCDWLGELRALESHRNTCPVELISCPNNCSLTASRKIINLHVDDCPKRWVPCEKCSLHVHFNTLETHTARCNRIVLSPSQPAINHKRHLIWSGELEWRETGKPIIGEETAPIATSERLLVHASIKPAQQTIDTQSWPTCLQLHLVRSDLLCYIQEACYSDRDPTMIALYLAGPHNHLVNGLYLQFVEKIGCVLFPEECGSTTEGFLMLWDRTLESFVAIMPKEQKGFRAQLKRIISHNNSKRRSARSTWIPDVFSGSEQNPPRPLQWIPPTSSSGTQTQRSARTTQGSRPRSRPRRNTNTTAATAAAAPAAAPLPPNHPFFSTDFIAHHFHVAPPPYAAPLPPPPPPPPQAPSIPQQAYVLTPEQQPTSSASTTSPTRHHHVMFHPYARYAAQPQATQTPQITSSNSSFFLPPASAAPVPAPPHPSHRPVGIGEHSHADAPFGLLWDCVANHRHHRFPVDFVPMAFSAGVRGDSTDTVRVPEVFLPSSGYAVMPSWSLS